MRSVQRSGVLEYTPAASSLADVAGLARLKEWIRKRGTALRDPVAARRFGVEPPRGLLLLGVQGCGKSLCAKAVASELAMPLVRLDPSSLYNKYFGESEKNLARAIRLAEAMAPVVLWIDELEKAFASVADGGHDGGVSHRLFGTFLTWLAETKETVFVVATANDVSRLPPELVRKGRFDEIFFVDLPGEDARRAVLTLHLRRRGQDPDGFELAPLVAASEGFSGAELEQVVVASLYTAFHEKRPLDAAMIAAEIAATVPLSRTMREKIAGLRAWARDRAVPAD
jgi:SpoVK/Ycf46/Vps4 family AAA+-type ATPase